MFNRQHIHQNKTIIALLLCILISIGILFVYSASAFYALQTHHSSWFYVKRQAIALLIGFVAFLITSSVSLDFLHNNSIFILITSLGATTLPIMLGKKIFGAARWISLGGITLQPSEFLKIAFVIYTASFLTRKKKRLDSFWKAYVPIMLILATTGIILLKQPDFGCLITIFSTVFCMLFIGNMNLQYLGITIASALPVFAGLIYYKPYRFARILTFLNPWKDPQGAGFQIIQSLIAVGSGGLWGTGIGQSKQKFFYLPMQHTDFIFAIIAEETGFIGASLIVLTFALLLYFIFTVSWKLRNRFAMFIMQGSGLLLSIQTCINIMVTLGMVPTKGLSLPFISYGNSALIAQCILVGCMFAAMEEYHEALY